MNVPYTPIEDGQEANNQLFNSRFLALHNAINGGLDAGNLADGAVTTPKLATDAVTAAKIADNAVTYAKLLSTIFSGAMTQYTPTMTAQSGGTWSSPVGYYLNLGGIKLAWGRVNFSSNGSANGHCAVSMPPSFFTSIQMAMPAIQSEGNYAYQFASGDGATTTTFGFYTSNSGTNGSCTVSWIVIGA